MKLGEIITDALLKDIEMRCVPRGQYVFPETVRAIAENGVLIAAANTTS